MLSTIISPLITPLISAVINFYKKKSIKLNLILFCLSISTALSLINSRKILESDIVNYNIFFNDSGIYTFSEYLSLHLRDSLFFMVTYIFYYLLNANFEMYVGVLTFICYFIFSLGILKICAILKVKNYITVSVLFAVFLFPNLFSLSAHVIRQFISSVFVILFLINYIIYDKNKFYLLLIAIFTHTSSLFFIITYFLPNKNTSKLKLSILILITILLFYIEGVSNLFLSTIQSIDVINYTFSRINNLGNKTLEKINWITISLAFTMIYITFISRKFYSKINKYPALIYLNLILTLLILQNFNNTELSLRYSYFLYFLFPLNLLLYLNYKSVNLSEKILKPLLATANGLFFLWFIYKLNYGIWTYSNLTDFLFLSYLSL
jgi:hypothetical protein